MKDGYCFSCGKSGKLHPNGFCEKCMVEERIMLHGKKVALNARAARQKPRRMDQRA